jgi:hypothetical protein
MPRRPVNYGELFALLEETHLTLIRVVAIPRMPQTARNQLSLLIERQATLILRDNGRGRYRRPPSAKRASAPASPRIS